ncbi:MAG: PfkB family carbohydrate kinase, partial [Rhodospirillales bacterium]|nr:PfkB family carbohydrate kinase [Rhodospirillales bacterium]
MASLLVVGSVAQDDVVHLQEPMREGMHIEGRGVGIRLGGGGPNTAIPLAHAGHDVAVVAAVGRDAAGDTLISELSAAGVDTGLIRVLDDAATTRSIIMVDDEGERTIVNLARTAEPEPPVRLLEAPADLIYV